MTRDQKTLRPDSLVVHAGQAAEPVTGAVMPPIFTSSTYAQKSPGVHSGFEYSRSHNPTRYALERMVSRLEGSTIEEREDASFGGFAFASGLAAMDCVLEMVPAGSEVVCTDDVYGGTYRQFTKVKKFSQDLRVKYVDMTDPAKLAAAVTSETRLVWVETPTNPLLKIVDLSAVSRIVREKLPSPGTGEHSCLLVCDNTFATPVNQRPMEHGFDLVHHSATKYLGGHSDVVGGILVAGRVELAQRLRFYQNAVGAVLGPFDSYLVLRGIKTLALRMARHNASGQRVAEFLSTHEAVARVIYPGLPSHPQHALAKKQMSGFTGMVTFFIKGGLGQARAFLENLRLFALAESLGGVESLVDHPAIMTHASVPPDQRQALGISDTLIRLSVGIEDVNDLIDDLASALAAARP